MTEQEFKSLCVAHSAIKFVLANVDWDAKGVVPVFNKEVFEAERVRIENTLENLGIT